MTEDVIQHCKSCDKCQRVNNRLGKAKSELHPIPVTAVWKTIGIDLIGKWFSNAIILVVMIINNQQTHFFMSIIK